MSDHQHIITASTGNKESVQITTTTTGGASTSNSEEGIEVIEMKRSLDNALNNVDVPSTPSIIDTRCLHATQMKSAHVPIHRNSSPRSLLDLDIMATNNSNGHDDDDDDDENRMSHSHDAYEIQCKTPAMRELDQILGNFDHDDDDDDDDDLKNASLVMDNFDDTNEPSKTVSDSSSKEQPPLPTLFSCTVDEIDEVVQDIVSPLEDLATPLEELISPFHRITDLLQCKCVAM